MRVTVLTVGGKMPSWVDAGCYDYQKRLPKEWRFEFKSIPLGQRSGNSVTRAIQAESNAILKQIKPKDFVVAMAVEGKSLSTEKVAKELRAWERVGENIVLMIGGPDGLAKECLDRANFLWSLSPLTLPHPVVRVVLVEQLYRAWSINQNHPYHRA